MPKSREITLPALTSGQSQLGAEGQRVEVDLQGCRGTHNNICGLCIGGFSEKAGCTEAAKCNTKGLCPKSMLCLQNCFLAISGILPLDLRIRGAANLYLIRKGKAENLIRNLDIETVETFTNTPHPAQTQRLGYTCLMDQSEIDNTNIPIKIFTDGSKLEGKVGAALSIWTGDRETRHLKLKLADYCTVYQAELLALSRASEVALEISNHKIGIYSDSRAAIEAVCSAGTMNKVALQTKKNIARVLGQNREISLFWVKAHAGLTGNERADELAKEAAVRLRVRPHYDLCPVSHAKRLIREKTLREWDRRYKEGTTGGVTKMFAQDIGSAHEVFKEIKLNKEITQALTGHGGLSGYLYRFKCKESPSCRCDPGKIEDVPHLLTECPIYSRPKYDLEMKIGLEININSIKEIVKHKKNREEFLLYCVKIIKEVNSINRTDNIQQNRR